MDIPKTQQELIKLLKEQDAHITLMRKAITRLDQKLNNAVRLVEKVRHDNRRLQQQNNTFEKLLTEMKSGLS